MAIARNRMVDGARRYARRAAHEIQVEQYDDQIPVTFAEDGTNKESGIGDREALLQAVKTLPRAQREAIEMLKLRELSLKEASAATGMSVAALKVSTHRAMGALRKVLQNT
jgi:RNA polymerase sigma-70 factor (ECF subfamily)